MNRFPGEIQIAIFKEIDAMKIKPELTMMVQMSFLQAIYIFESIKEKYELVSKAPDKV